MKKLLTQASVATIALAAATIAVASDSADTGVTEMNAGLGTVGALVGGIAVMGVVVWLGIKVMNRRK